MLILLRAAASVSTSSSKTMQGVVAASSANTVPRRWETACCVLPCAALASACGSTSMNVEAPLNDAAVREASPRASDVLPVPGGPTNRMMPCNGRWTCCSFGSGCEVQDGLGQQAVLRPEGRMMDSQPPSNSPSGSGRISWMPFWLADCRLGGEVCTHRARCSETLISQRLTTPLTVNLSHVKILIYIAREIQYHFAWYGWHEI